MHCRKLQDLEEQNRQLLSTVAKREEAIHHVNVSRNLHLKWYRLISEMILLQSIPFLFHNGNSLSLYLLCTPDAKAKEN